MSNKRLELKGYFVKKDYNTTIYEVVFTVNFINLEGHSRSFWLSFETRDNGLINKFEDDEFCERFIHATWKYFLVLNSGSLKKPTRRNTYASYSLGRYFYLLGSKAHVIQIRKT